MRQENLEATAVCDIFDRNLDAAVEMVQTGTMQRSAVHFAKAAEIVHSGELDRFRAPLELWFGET
jgi:hypothetical protein